MCHKVSLKISFHDSISLIYVSEDTAIPVSLDGQRLILANGTLVLRSVKAEDSGYYTCTATNTLGFDTIIVNLLVQGRKMAAFLRKKHFTLLQKEQLFLSGSLCVFLPSPSRPASSYCLYHLHLFHHSGLDTRRQWRQLYQRWVTLQWRWLSICPPVRSHLSLPFTVLSKSGHFLKFSRTNRHIKYNII